MDYHFIYLIKEKQDIDSGASIYKIGKSTQENTRRVKSYPSGSYLILQVACIDCHIMENYLIKIFKELFIIARGREYFEGDSLKMINLIYFIVQSDLNSHTVEYMMTDNNNLSLVVKYDNDAIRYSFDNKDNIIEEYKSHYKYLEIKYNKYVRDTRETMQSLEIKHNNLDKKYQSLEIKCRALRGKVSNEKIDDLCKLNNSSESKINEITTSKKLLIINHNKLVKEYQLLCNNNTNRLCVGLFIIYGITYHIYLEPYSATNWLLLLGSSLFIKI